MAHRIREAMKDSNPSPLGGEGKTVEVDETLVGGKERNKRLSKRNPKNIGAVGKQVVFSLVERGGKARSVHVANVTAKTLRPIIVKHVSRKSALMADDAGQYRSIGPEFASFETVNHGADEYVRGDAHTNTIEGFFSIMKRGIIGTYHHVSEAHLHRYLAEFDFRYNTRTALGVNDRSAPPHHWKASTASALPIGGLVKPKARKQQARQLLALRKKRYGCESRESNPIPKPPPEKSGLSGPGKGVICMSTRIGRSAISGRYTTVKRRRSGKPNTHVVETVKPPKKPK